MEELKQYLREGESLLWTGKPSDFETMDKQYKSINLKKIVIMLGIAIALSAAYIISCSSNGVEIKWGLIVILAVIGLYGLYSPFGDAGKLRKKFTYGVTNQRIIIYVDKCRSVEYNEIENASFAEDAAGTTSLLINKAVEEAKKGNIRTLAVTCVNKDDTEFPLNAALYAIPDAAAVKAILKEHISCLS